MESFLNVNLIKSPTNHHRWRNWLRWLTWKGLTRVTQKIFSAAELNFSDVSFNWAAEVMCKRIHEPHLRKQQAHEIITSPPPPTAASADLPSRKGWMPLF